MRIKRIIFVLICFLQEVIASYNIAERRGELNFQIGEAEAMYVYMLIIDLLLISTLTTLIYIINSFAPKVGQAYFSH